MPSKTKRRIVLELLLLLPLLPLLRRPLLAPVSSLVCAFCGRPGHTVERCFKFAESSKKAKEEVQQSASNSKKRSTKPSDKANAPQDTPTPTESAGAASICLSSSPSSLPDAWNADTGATSHMTPRREWFKSYTP